MANNSGEFKRFKILKIDNLIILFLSIFVSVVSLFIFRGIEKVPMHYNVYGLVDIYGSKYWYLLFSFLSFFVAIAIDFLTPEEKKFKSYKELKLFKYILVAILDLIVLGSILSNLFRYDFILYLCILIGLFFIFVGLISPNVQRNKIIGIKTYWTLKDDDVWSKTQKKGKFGYFLIGIIFIVFGFFKTVFVLFLLIVAIIGFAIYMFYYSYELYNGTDDSNLIDDSNFDEALDDDVDKF